jgi:hypothetical protein
MKNKDRIRKKTFDVNRPVLIAKEWSFICTYMYPLDFICAPRRFTGASTVKRNGNDGYRGLTKRQNFDTKNF